jgi:hypothetical protein
MCWKCPPHSVMHTFSLFLMFVACPTTDWMAGVRSPTEAEDFSSNLSIQTSSWAHPASYTMGIGGAPSPGGKVWLMLITHPLLVPRLAKSWSYTSCHPNVPLWSVAGPLYLFFYLMFVATWWRVSAVMSEVHSSVFCFSSSNVCGLFL